MEHSRHCTGEELKIDVLVLCNFFCLFLRSQIAVTVFALIVTTIYILVTAQKDVGASSDLIKGVPVDSKAALTENAEDELKDQEGATP